MGGEDSEKQTTEPPGPSEAKETGNAWAGARGLEEAVSQPLVL